MTENETRIVTLEWIRDIIKERDALKEALAKERKVRGVLVRITEELAILCSAVPESYWDCLSSGLHEANERLQMEALAAIAKAEELEEKP